MNSFERIRSHIVELDRWVRDDGASRNGWTRVETLRSTMWPPSG